MDLKWPLRLAEDRRDAVLILVLAGRLGAAAAPTFEAAVAAAVGRGETRLVVDLTAVDYISSAGLQALAAAAALCVKAHGTLAICGLSDPVRIAFDLSGLLAGLAVEPSRDEAIGRVTRPTPAAGRNE
jgi:anti-anti-sigma factor